MRHSLDSVLWPALQRTRPVKEDCSSWMPKVMNRDRRWVVLATMLSNRSLDMVKILHALNDDN